MTLKPGHRQLGTLGRLLGPTARELEPDSRGVCAHLDPLRLPPRLSPRRRARPRPRRSARGRSGDRRAGSGAVASCRRAAPRAPRSVRRRDRPLPRRAAPGRGAACHGRPARKARVVCGVGSLKRASASSVSRSAASAWPSAACSWACVTERPGQLLRRTAAKCRHGRLQMLRGIRVVAEVVAGDPDVALELAAERPPRGPPRSRLPPPDRRAAPAPAPAPRARPPGPRLCRADARGVSSAAPSRRRRRPPRPRNPPREGARWPAHNRRARSRAAPARREREPTCPGRRAGVPQPRRTSLEPEESSLEAAYSRFQPATAETSSSPVASARATVVVLLVEQLESLLAELVGGTWRNRDERSLRRPDQPACRRSEVACLPPVARELQQDSPRRSPLVRHDRLQSLSHLRRGDGGGRMRSPSLARRTRSGAAAGRSARWPSARSTTHRRRSRRVAARAEARAAPGPRPRRRRVARTSTLAANCSPWIEAPWSSV